MRGRQSGFTLVELLIVVAIIGLVAVIAIPNMVNALNRGRQKRTMADIRSVAIAIEAYGQDMGFFPKVGAGWGSSPLDDLGPFVVPTYIRTLPSADGWHHAFWFRSGAAPGLGIGNHYWIESFGMDNIDDPDPAGLTPTADFNQDIIWLDGNFLEWPEGAQS